MDGSKVSFGVYNKIRKSLVGTRGRYFQPYLHFNNCAEWSIFSIMVTYARIHKKVLFSVKASSQMLRREALQLATLPGFVVDVEERTQEPS